MTYMQHSGRIFLAFLLMASGILCTGVMAAGSIQLDLPDSVEIGDSFIIQGTIDPTAPVLFPDDLTLMIRAPMDSHVEQFSTLTPDANRTFKKTILADITGKWTVSVRYGDLTTGPAEITVIPRTVRKKTTLDLYPYGMTAEVRDQIEMTGVLRDSSGNGVSGRKVYYQVGLPSYSWYGMGEPDEDERIWQTYGTVYTGESGMYTFSFKEPDTGVYGVRTRFSGDEVYRASKSTMETVRIT